MAALPEGIAPNELQQRYDDRKLRISIIPGHDDETGSGARFAGLKEADVNLQLAKNLVSFFRNDGHFAVFLTRDDNGYLSWFKDYFENRREEILAFRDEARKNINTLLEQGQFVPKTIVDHNFASAEDALKLYGINKWTQDNNIDLAIHIHFNDYPDRPWNEPGKYSGFSIYIPESQLPNHKTSRILAQSISSQLIRYFHASTNPVEKDGIIEDQKLIAIGTNGSLKNPSILIEYSYLYESPLIASAGIRRPLLNEMAYQTYRGVKLYFDPGAEPFLAPSSFLPRRWDAPINFGVQHNPEALALQIALSQERVYPATGFDPHDCLLTGSFGPCTKGAVQAFQRKYKLPVTGGVGPLTLDTLNEIYNYRLPQSGEDFKHTWDTDLVYGTKNNADVAALQNALLIEHVYNGPITGNFFGQTRDALKTFQQRKGIANIPSQGIAGPRTRKVLNDIYSK